MEAQEDCGVCKCSSEATGTGSGPTISKRSSSEMSENRFTSSGSAKGSDESLASAGREKRSTNDELTLNELTLDESTLDELTLSSKLMSSSESIEPEICNREN